MAKSDDVPTAKVFVWKDAGMGEPNKPWKVGLMGWGDLLVITYDAVTYEEAWEWLYTNYKRDTV
jgi:hypothetical protein